MWFGSAFNRVPLPPQNMWQSRDSGETKSLAAWADGYVLTQNPDGSVQAKTKFSNGIPPQTLVKIAGPNQNPFAAESERPVIFQRQSNTHDQWWEHPDNITITTGTCAGANSQSYAGELFYNDQPKEYRDAKLFCKETWEESYQSIDNSDKLYDLTIYQGHQPHTLPAGWRVDSGGHLTNLPNGLDVSSSSDALKKGVAVIEPDSQEWKVSMPCIFYVDANESQFSESECISQGYVGTEIFVKYFSWAITEATKYHQQTGGTGKLMWWLKSPTFTASCTDESNSKYNADAHYWDNTHCQNATDDDNESTPTTDSGGFVAAGLAIVLITAGATIYGGKI